MKILFWILVLPLLLAGLIFVLILIVLILSLIPLRKKKISIVRWQTIHPDDRKIVDAEWSEKKD